MTYAILLKTAYGWTDYIGFPLNSWEDRAEAEAGAAAIAGEAEWKVVESGDLASYDLIS